jgi:HPt (histidine-containing phosphotransfer) domain-containing protein
VDAIHEAPALESGNDPVDWKRLCESVDGDETFLRDLVNAYIGSGDKELAAIAAAQDAGDTATMRASAHTLKGASANLRAAAATLAAARLEAAADLKEYSKIPALAENLASEIGKAIAYLRSVAGERDIRQGARQDTAA